MEEQVKQTPTGDETVKTVAQNETNSNDSKIIWIIVGIILVLAGLIYLFIRLGPEVTGQIRDVTLIITALEFIITTTAFVVLCVQAAKLVNFLKYEISPILKTTEKTAKKLYGTASFLSDAAVEPTIEAASTVSGIRKAADTILSIFK